MKIKKYCIWCGSQLGDEAQICSCCGKAQPEKENGLIDWLVSKTKDEFKDEAEDSLISAVKNFILSHLYGTVMSVMVVVAATVTIYASEPYIHNVNINPDELQNIINSEYWAEEIIDDPMDNGDYDMTANVEIHDICSKYLRGFGEGIKVDPELGLHGVYEVAGGDDFNERAGGIKRTEFNHMLHTQDISQKLSDMGYTVGECVAEQWDDSSKVNCGYRKIIFVFVQVDGQWYMAENRILEQIQNSSQE